MSKLIFKHGAMGSSKSADLIMTNYNLSTTGINTVIIRPSRDSRARTSKVHSRIGLEATAEEVPNYFDVDYITKRKIIPQVILIDEIQFFKPETIDNLVMLADKYNIQIFCYGLMRDFKEKLFPSSQRLVEVGAKLVEVKSTCHSTGCMNSASHTLAKFDDGVIIGKEAPQFLIELGKKIEYISLCRQCYNKEHKR